MVSLTINGTPQMIAGNLGVVSRLKSKLHASKNTLSTRCITLYIVKLCPKALKGLCLSYHKDS